MTTDGDHSNLKIKLLSQIELDECVAVVAEIFSQVVPARATGVVMWDADLENFADRFVFGEKKKGLAKLLDALDEEFEGKPGVLFELDLDELGVSLEKELTPVFCYELEFDEVRSAVIVVAGVDLDSDEDPDEVKEKTDELNEFPLSVALHNAWECAELKRENDRLRSQYQEMEDKTSVLEDQTVKLIHDIQYHNTVKSRQVERERLVYSISNIVRSSVHIREVLDTTVKEIGNTFGVNRCLLLRAVDSVDQLSVFEYIKGPESVKEAFFSEQGLEFTRVALSKTNPHDIGDPEIERHAFYDNEFLRKLGMRSGLIIPLVVRERTLGVLFLQDCQEPRHWSIDDVSLIGSLADNVSVAIENAELHQEREMQAVTDGLTGIANRRSFSEALVREFERARRYEEPLSLVVIDLDFLKKINDTYGHKAGDEAIQTIGRLLKQSSRSIDLPARYGGEEFCLLLPNTEIDMAEQLADRLRRLINEVEVEGPGRISASLGVASYPLHADDPDMLFHKADEALYVAKQNGRNQVRIATNCLLEAHTEANEGNGGTAIGGSTGTESAPTEVQGTPIDSTEGPSHQSTILDVR